MRMVDLIQKKQQGHVLNTSEINFIVEGFTAGEIPDYQMSAFAMAVYFQGMNVVESSNLTMAIVNTGKVLDWSDISGVKVDKHSTGGVGDKTSLVVGPLVAALGIPMIKLSGRGLGHTGGTLDKLESFAGFQVECDLEKLPKQIDACCLALMGQSEELTPGDKKLYALRDVTSTVMSIPLIASSIMSKKIASGADVIILDVKVGSGAFMKTNEEAEELARLMVDIGNNVGRKTIAVLSNMSQPLGVAVGNTLEVEEAIACLQGQGPEDVMELSLVLAERLVIASGKAKNKDEARNKLEQVIKDGSALQCFATFIRFQGGNEELAFSPSKFPKSTYVTKMLADKSGYITEMKTEGIGHSAMLLGAGRATKDDKIDVAVGFLIHKKIGNYVNEGEIVATVHHNKKDITQEMELLRNSISISNEQVDVPKLIQKIVE